MWHGEAHVGVFVICFPLYLLSLSWVMIPSCLDESLPLRYFLGFFPSGRSKRTEEGDIFADVSLGSCMKASLCNPEPLFLGVKEILQNPFVKKRSGLYSIQSKIFSLRIFLIL